MRLHHSRVEVQSLMARKHPVGVTLRQQRIAVKPARQKPDNYLTDFERMVDLCKEKVALYEHSARLKDREEAGKWRSRLRRWEAFVAHEKALVGSLNSAGIQAKLVIGDWDDALEDEAETDGHAYHPGFGSD